MRKLQNRDSATLVDYTLGRKIFAARKSQNRSILEMATVLDINELEYCRLERGEVRISSIQIAKIAVKLEISVADLFNGTSWRIVDLSLPSDLPQSLRELIAQFRKHHSS